MGKPHKYAEVVKAWADGATAQYFNPPAYKWMDAQSPSFDESLQWRIKPEPPKSSLSPDDCYMIFQSAKDSVAGQLKAVADAAVERHCQDQEKEGK